MRTYTIVAVFTNREKRLFTIPAANRADALAKLGRMLDRKDHDGRRDPAFVNIEAVGARYPKETTP